MRHFRQHCVKKTCKQPLDLSLYLVTHRDKETTLKDFMRRIKLALDGGVSVVQLREKNTQFNQYLKIARIVKPLCDDYKVPLVINDNPHVARAVNTDWLHLGQNDFCVYKARQLLGPNAVIGLSVENQQQALQALSLPINYIALSPIFYSQIRPDLVSPWGLAATKAIRNKTNMPIVAIGGIKINNAQTVLDAGVDGLCVISAIFHQPCPKTAANEFRELIDQHQRRTCCEKV